MAKGMVGVSALYTVGVSALLTVGVSALLTVDVTVGVSPLLTAGVSAHCVLQRIQPVRCVSTQYVTQYMSGVVAQHIIEQQIADMST